MDKKNKIRVVSTILVLVVVLIIFFNYEEIVEFIREAIIDIFRNDNSKDKCEVPSCNPENNKQYCLDNKWVECPLNEICLEGKCTSYQATPNSNNKNEEAAVAGVACIGEGCKVGEGGTSIGESAYKYILKIKKQGTGFGTITTDSGFTCEVDYEECNVNYADATMVVATANPLSESSIFSGWNGCDSVNNNICTLSLESNETITVTFNFIPES